jgi:hypothetical protein
MSLEITISMKKEQKMNEMLASLAFAAAQIIQRQSG